MLIARAQLMFTAGLVRGNTFLCLPVGARNFSFLDLEAKRAHTLLSQTRSSVRIGRGPHMPCCARSNPPQEEDERDSAEQKKLVDKAESANLQTRVDFNTVILPAIVIGLGSAILLLLLEDGAREGGVGDAVGKLRFFKDYGAVLFGSGFLLKINSFLEVSSIKNESLIGSVKKDVEVLSTKVDKDLERLSSKVDNLVGSVKDLVALSTKVDKCLEVLSTKVDKDLEALSTKVDNLAGSGKKDLEVLSAKVDYKIDNLEKSLGKASTKADRLAARFDKHADDRADNMSRLARLEEKVKFFMTRKE